MVGICVGVLSGIFFLRSVVRVAAAQVPLGRIRVPVLGRKSLASGIAVVILPFASVLLVRKFGVGLFWSVLGWLLRMSRKVSWARKLVNAVSLFECFCHRLGVESFEKVLTKLYLSLVHVTIIFSDYEGIAWFCRAAAWNYSETVRSGCSAKVFPVQFEDLNSFSRPCSYTAGCIEASKQMLEINILAFELEVQSLPGWYNFIVAVSN